MANKFFKNIKRKIGVALALVMVFEVLALGGFGIFSSGGMNVSAALPNGFDVSFDNPYFSWHQPSGVSPLRQYNVAIAQRIPTASFNFTGFEQGDEFILEYPIANNRFASWRIVGSGVTARVYYREFSTGNTDPVTGDMLPILSGGATGVYSHVQPPPGGSFVSPFEHGGRHHEPGRNHHVDIDSMFMRNVPNPDHDPDDPNSPEYLLNPSAPLSEVLIFNLERNTGFTFNVMGAGGERNRPGRDAHGDVETSFFWDGNRFYITTDNLQAGTFHDFTLSRVTPAADPADPPALVNETTVTVFGEFDTRELIVEPLSGFFTRLPGDPDEMRDFTEIIDWSGPVDDHPGINPNAIRVTVPFPRTWDGDTFEPTTEAELRAALESIIIDFRADMTRTEPILHDFRAEFGFDRDTASATYGEFGILVQGSFIGGEITGGGANPDGSFTFTMEFPDTAVSWASTLFRDSRLRVRAPGRNDFAASGWTHLGEQQIHTFLEYQYLYQGDTSWLVVRPYNMPGFYALTRFERLILGDDGEDYEVVEVRQLEYPAYQTTEALWFPILTQTSSHYRIVFTPGIPPNGGFGNANNVNPFPYTNVVRNPNANVIFSQRVFFRYSDHKYDIGFPTQFEISDFQFFPRKDDGRPPIGWRDRDPDNVEDFFSMESDERNLRYNMSWNISSYHAIAARIRAEQADAAAAGASFEGFKVFYDFLVRESPIRPPHTAEVPQTYASLMVTFDFGGDTDDIGASGARRITARFEQVVFVQTGYTVDSAGNLVFDNNGNPIPIFDYEIVPNNSPLSVFINYSVDDITDLDENPNLWVPSHEAPPPGTTGRAGRVRGFIELRTFAYPQGSFDFNNVGDGLLPWPAGTPEWPYLHEFAPSFRYSNIYFASIRTRNHPALPIGGIVGPESMLESFTLNDFHGWEVPSVFNVGLTALPAPSEGIQPLNRPARVRAEWTVPTMGILDYLRRLPEYDRYNVRFNMYVSHSEDRIVNMRETGANPDWVMSLNDELTQTGTMHFSALSVPELGEGETLGDDVFLIRTDGDVDEWAIDALRNNRIVGITDMLLFEDFVDLAALEDETALVNFLTNRGYSFILDGLDRNQRYFVAFDLSVEFYDEEITYTFPVFDGTLDSLLFINPATPPTGTGTLPATDVTARPDTNRLTAIAGVTTWGDLPPPDPQDRTPPAPQLSRRDVGMSYATVYWPQIIESVPEDGADYGHLAFEMIVMRGRQMERELLTDTTRTFRNVFENAAGTPPPTPMPEMRGFRIDPNASPPPSALFRRWSRPTANEFNLEERSPNLVGYFDEVFLTDDELSPNSTYFYYVRTVRIVNGVPVAYSSWSEISVTTTPVRPPVNLIVLRTNNAERFQGFNNRTEMVIQFYAPINPNMLGQYYDLYVSYRRDNLEWGADRRINPNSQNLILPQTGETVLIDGVPHWRYIYRIQNLEPGSNYSFRVRTRDLTHRDWSAYSNTAYSRTEFDQDEFDRDRDRNDWIEFLRIALGQIFDDEFWTTDSTNTTFAAVWRPTVFPSVLAQQRDSMIRLNVPQGAVDYTIYLPSSVLADAFAQNRGFTIRRGDMEVSVMPHTLMRENPALLSAVNRINNRNTPDADYHLRINLSFTRPAPISTQTSPAPPFVDGRFAAGYRVDVSLELVTIRTAAIDWDRSVIDMIARYLANDDNLIEALDEIRRRVNIGQSHEQLLWFVDDYVRRARPRIYRQIDQSLRLNRQGGATINVALFNRPLRLALHGTQMNETIGGFQLANGVWMSRAVEVQGAARVMDVTQSGAYMFNSVVLSFVGVETMFNGARLSEIMTRFTLGDFLGFGPSFNINAPITINALTGSVARIGGAAQGVNHANFLRQRGFVMPARSNAQSATLQETVYFVMAAYEMRTGTRVNSIQITNFGTAAQLRGVDMLYRQSVQAAFELGILTADTNFNPNRTVTAGEFLELIGRLDAIIRLT